MGSWQTEERRAKKRCDRLFNLLELRGQEEAMSCVYNMSTTATDNEPGVKCYELIEVIHSVLVRRPQ